VCLGIIYALKVLGVKSGYVIPYSMMIRVLLHSSLICGLTGYLTGLLNINTFITLGLSGLISAILILLTGDLLGIPYRAIIKSMLLNAPGISLIKRLRERLA
jgi:hypothetical protein